MNAALFLMSVMAGADTQAPPPPPPAHHHPAPAPIVAPGIVAPGFHAPCGDCAAPCSDVCCEKAGLFARLRARFQRNKHDDCGCGAPVYHGFTTAGCDTCERHGWGSGPGLFSRWRNKKHGGDCCDTGCSPCGPWQGGAWTAGHWGGGCALPPVPGTVPPAPVPTAPKEMPKKTGTTTGSLDVPGLVPTVSIPSVPAAGTRNPF